MHVYMGGSEDFILVKAVSLLYLYQQHWLLLPHPPFNCSLSLPPPRPMTNKAWVFLFLFGHTALHTTFVFYFLGFCRPACSWLCSLVSYHSILQPESIQKYLIFRVAVPRGFVTLRLHPLRLHMLP